MWNRNYLILFLLFLETLSLTYFHGLFSIEINSILFCISGFAIAFFPLFIKQKHTTIKASISLKIPFVIAGILFSFFLLNKTWNGINAVPFGSGADMMQFIDIQCERFLNNQTIYTPVESHWNVYPPHFPAYWLPFVPFKCFSIDIRWTLIVLLIATLWLVIYALIKMQNQNELKLPVIIIAGCLFLFFNYLIQKNLGFTTITQEGVALFYYSLLGFSLWAKKPVITGIAIALCLLSRFYILAFVPFYFVFLFTTKNRKIVGIELLSCALVLLFVGVPFFIQTPKYFFYLPTQYRILDANLWKVDFKTVLNGYGLAKYFHQNQYELVNRLNTIIPFVIPVLFYFIVYIKRMWKNVDLNLISICGIKLLMCFFYAIVQAPYSYLFLVPALFSYFVVMIYFNQFSNQQTPSQLGLIATNNE